MSGAAPKFEIKNAKGKKIAIISSSWHPELCQKLIDSAIRACEEHGATYEVIYVPGSFEIPFAARKALTKGFNGFAGAVALGLVLRGQTAHFEYVCEGATYGIMKTQLETFKPIGFGVLMCDTLEQAHDRAGGKVEDKGYDAAIATLALL
ncbi:MAG: 6,7-dimethyl-8-ribityllumazine synthase [Candidatus Nanopelagicaceae bacterium]|jgi:6,7-dimethyl-8-ribityllumazine synthase|nr:6,7-dimethyl-8-ribityllumazine synthase [Candidatus Nanopelagicaceae bacterium]